MRWLPVALCLMSCREPATPATWADIVIDEVATGLNGMVIGLDFDDGAIGLAVGGTTERGPSLVARSDDGGHHWHPVDVRATGRLYDVAFASANVACAVGYGVVLRSENAGATWMSATLPEGDVPWFGGIAFADAKRGFAVGGGEHPVVWETRDAGATWSDVSQRIPAEATGSGLRAIAFFDTVNGVATGQDGIILRTSSAGQDWRLANVELPSAWLKGLSTLGSDTGLVVGTEGVVLRTDDVGTSWRRLAFPTTEKLNAAGFLDETTACVGSMEGRIFISDGQGSPWELAAETNERPIIGMAQRSRELWCSCDAGTLLRVHRR